MLFHATRRSGIIKGSLGAERLEPPASEGGVSYFLFFRQTTRDTNTKQSGAARRVGHRGTAQSLSFTMARGEVVWNDVNDPTGVSVFVPLDKHVIEKLNEVKDKVETKKYGEFAWRVRRDSVREVHALLLGYRDDCFTHTSRFFHTVYMQEASREATRKFGGAYHKTIATELVLLVIDEFVPGVHNREALLEYLQLSNHVAYKTGLNQLGIDPSHVLVKVAGIQIVLLDLDEALFRADLFTKTQHIALREVVSRDAALAEKSPSKATPRPTTAPAPAKSPPSTKQLPAAGTPKKTKSNKHCMNGAECRNILNGTCRFHHTPEDIAKAGAIIEEVIGISVCKVGWIIGTNGDNITYMQQDSGADIWIEDEVVNGKMRMLHVLGSREAVEKGVELVMESAAKCNDDASLSNFEALVGITPAKQKLLVASEALKEMKEASGADIFVGESCCSLQVVGTKEAVEKGIELVMEWAARDEKGSMTTTPTSMTNATPTAQVQSRSTSSSSAAMVTNASVSPNKPANLNDGAAWPSLAAPSKKPAAANPQRVAVRPMIQLTTKKAKNSKTPSRASTKAKAKKKDAPICIHGANCRYIRNGRDECEFYHSAKELELAADAAAAASKVEHVMYISRAEVGRVIGRKGARVKEIIKESGADIANDATGDGSDETRIVRITGTQKSVDVAIEMIMAQLPEGYDVESGREVSSSVASSENSNAKPTVTTQPEIATAREPSPAPDSRQSTTVISPTHPVQQFQPIQPVVEPGAFISSSTSLSSGSGALVSDVTPTARAPSPAPDPQQSTGLVAPTQPMQQAPYVQQVMMEPGAFVSSTTSLSSGSGALPRSSEATQAAISYGHYEGYSEPATIMGETIPTLAHSMSGYYPAPNTMSLQPHCVRQQSMEQDIEARVMPTVESPIVVTPTPTDTLLAFLKEQAACLKGSPEAFHSWLSTEDIVTIANLAEAASDDDYLRDVLQQGDGTVGVKGFKRKTFKKAVVEASQSALDANDTGTDVSSTKSEPLAELICPISHVLMTNDPVIAADGHTYERAAIEAWFDKQYSEVIAAKQQMDTVGGDSQRARRIMDRGVLSPMTHAKMQHLNLTPNHAVRTMAKDVAASSN